MASTMTPHPEEAADRASRRTHSINPSNDRHTALDRRRMVGGIVTGLAGASLFPVLIASAENLPPTPAQTAGPFYPQKFPADSDGDLVHVAGHNQPARGTVTQVSGRIFDVTGRPLASAQVEIWQADANGRYHDPRDTHAGPGP